MMLSNISRIFYHFIALHLVLCTSSCVANRDKDLRVSEDAKPNIVFILADDMGYGDISTLNRESGTHTPNLDRLAKEGIHFTDAHSNSSVCTPTRYGIMTGRYAWRTRLKNDVLWGYDPPLIEKGRETVASFLKSNNYYTACIGKWHLGLGWQQKDASVPISSYRWDEVFEEGDDSNVDFSKKVTGGPNELGFDYSYVIPASLDMTPYLYLENGLATELPTVYTKGKSEERHGRGVFWRAGEASPGFDFYNVQDHLTDKALEIIDSRSKEKEPFFLYLPFAAPHTPWLPGKNFEAKSECGKYGDFVQHVDASVGLILGKLDELGLAENTIVVFTSDNGAHWEEEDKNKFDHRANYIFRGQKADIYEGGHRVPYLARWNGHIKPNTKSNELICTTDLLATVAGMINKPLPEGAGEDSYNLWGSYVDNPKIGKTRDHVIHHSLHGHYAIRKGKWKATPHLGSGGFTQPIEMDADNNTKGTLYDLEKDPGETENLYLQFPEIRDELIEILEIKKNDRF